MKKIIMSLFVASVLLMGAGFTQASMMNNQNSNPTTTQQTPTPTIASALQDIYTSQNITGQAQLDCSKVTDTQFEKLGDAVMGSGIGEAQHTTMENMMGGEGSATLKQAHITMARAYVGCWSNYNGVVPTMSMMGGYGSYNYPVNYGRHGMMGGYYGYGACHILFGVITILIVWVLMILGIMAAVKYLRKK